MADPGPCRRLKKPSAQADRQEAAARVNGHAVSVGRALSVAMARYGEAEQIRLIQLTKFLERFRIEPAFGGSRSAVTCRPLIFRAGRLFFGPVCDFSGRSVAFLDTLTYGLRSAELPAVKFTELCCKWGVWWA